MENKKNGAGTIKLALDIVMSILFIVVYNSEATGLQLHEIMGLFIFVLFLFHKVLNFSWIKAVLTNLKKVGKQARLFLTVDILMFVAVTACMVSGVLISETILTQIVASNMELATTIHHATSTASMILIVAHIWLHRKVIVSGMKKMFNKGGKTNAGN